MLRRQIAVEDVGGELYQKVIISGIVGSGGSVTPAIVPTIFNVVLATGGVEYSQVLPTQTKKLLVKGRFPLEVQLAFINGQSNSNYITIPPGMTYWDDLILPMALTIYLQSVSTQHVEVIAWS